MQRNFSAVGFKRKHLVSSALLGVSLLAGTAAAQSSAGTSAAALPPIAAQAPGSQIQDIVVTAERRETTVQRTPATIEVVGAATLERQRIVNFSDLNSVLNNTQIVPIGIATQVVIRGIGNNFVDPRADPSVATSVNGLFYSRPLPLGFAFLDVARVENLEGPQGTLYGRNAAAGALNIITNQPINKWTGSLQVSGGNLGENQVTAVLNVPVTDRLAIRGAYDRNRRDGFVDSYFDDINTDTGRISARWTPTDQLTIYAESNYEHIGGHGTSPEPYPCAGAIPFSTYTPAHCNALTLYRLPGQPIISGHLDSHVASDLVHIDYDLGDLQSRRSPVTSIRGKARPPWRTAPISPTACIPPAMIILRNCGLRGMIRRRIRAAWPGSWAPICSTATATFSSTHSCRRQIVRLPARKSSAPSRNRLWPAMPRQPTA